MGRPVPTHRVVTLLALGLLPAVASVALPGLVYVVAAWNAGLLALTLIDFYLSPPRQAFALRRGVVPVLSSGTDNQIGLELHSRHHQRTSGWVRDSPHPQLGRCPPLAVVLEASSQLSLSYRLTPPQRGNFEFGNLYLRVVGPLGLCQREHSFEAPARAQVFPDLRALSLDAMALARLAELSPGRIVRRPEEGREFDSLRDFRTGDDFRNMDWKASAKRDKPMIRVHRPERNQTVLLLLDCGRHMAGRVGERRKLDYAVDAALRLAKVCIDKGDSVGLVAFARRMKIHLPPRKSQDSLHAMARALYTLEADLVESDYGAALETAFSRQNRRALVVLFTDLMDFETSRALVRRTALLRPRHLPWVISLLDEELLRAAEEVPQTSAQAYARPVAARLEDEYRLTVARLKTAGALVMRARPSHLGPETVREYLRIKARGLL